MKFGKFIKDFPHGIVNLIQPVLDILQILLVDLTTGIGLPCQLVDIVCGRAKQIQNFFQFRDFQPDGIAIDGHFSQVRARLVVP